jgi:hypothetical protein
VNVCARDASRGGLGWSLFDFGWAGAYFMLAVSQTIIPVLVSMIVYIPV